jgi:hypothetical protein
MADEPGTIAAAGHSLFPTVVAAGAGAALLVRRYGPPQAAALDAGEGRARLRAFETALLWPGTPPGPLGAAEVLHVAAMGGLLSPPAAVACGDGLLVAWQGDLGTRNARSDVCLAFRRARPAGDLRLEPLAPAPAPPVAADAGAIPEPDRAPPVPAGLYFGNVHMHSEQSFCRRATSLLLDFNYRWAQDCMGQDFAVLTDHAETKSVYEWWLNRKAAAFFTTPRFAALLGYEWTSRHDPQSGAANGHLDVYFRDDPPRFWPANAVESASASGLWEILARGEAAGHPAFTVAHHPAVGAFRRGWDVWGGERFEPVVEIHQDRRGSFERPGAPGGAVLDPQDLVPGHYVADALARGYRLGFVSGGDHMGISMTAVRAAALTRAAVFDAIRARRCYAVTGAKIVLDVAVDGVVDGEGAAPEPGREVTLTARCLAPAAVRRLVLVQDGVDGAAVAGGEAAPDGAGGVGRAATLRARLTPRRGGHVYVRAELVDGEIAWSSPIFFPDPIQDRAAP